jgi:hypothetical protein
MYQYKRYEILPELLGFELTGNSSFVLDLAGWSSTPIITNFNFRCRRCLFVMRFYLG